MKRKIWTTTAFSLFIIMQLAYAYSNIGTPFIKNYPTDVYQAGLQNWDIGQDQYGKMYFANNEGLLTFDGANWKLFKVENETKVRSLLIDGERIYVGAQGDFGYFEPNEKGSLVYYSLKEKMPKAHQKFADVWDIVKSGEQLYFKTYNKVFVYNDAIQLIASDQDFVFFQKEQDDVLLQSRKNGLYKVHHNTISAFLNNPLFLEDNITGALTINNQLLVTSLKSGVFSFDGNALLPWKMNDNNLIKGHRINCAMQIDDERIALGTLTGGLFIVDHQGKVLHRINVKEGLQSNEVLNIFKDGKGNIWLALSNGIDYIEINSPYAMIKPDRGLGGSGYAAKVHDGKIYFGMSNGLYAIDWKAYYHPLNMDTFQLIKNTKGQVWGLNTCNDELLLSHHEGAFRVENGRIHVLSDLSGSWLFQPLQKDEHFILEGNYQGLSIYEYKNGHHQLRNRVSNIIDESCRIVAQDKDGTIWVAHPFRGVYKIQLDGSNSAATSFKLYNTEQGFPTDWVHVFNIGESLVFTSERGIYEYYAQEDTFKLSEEWGTVFPHDSWVKKLVEDNNGNIWFVKDDDVGIIKVKNTGLQKQLDIQYHPKLKGKLVGSFEHIYPFDEENVFFAVGEGFIHFNPIRAITEDTLFNVHLQEVTLGDSTLVFGGWQTQKWIRPNFKHNQNSFVFKYAASSYSDFKLVSFQYRLKGLEDDWSLWRSKNIKEYTSLRPGSYEFQVRAQDAHGNVTAIKAFEFVISPPWYLSYLAIAIYMFIGVGSLFGLILIPRRQFEKEKAMLKQEQEKTLDETTKVYEKIVADNQAAITQLQQEKLKTEIQHKTQELATATMHLVQKGELINKLIEKLTAIQKSTEDPSIKKEIRSTIQLLNQSAQLDEDWEQFATYFDQVHANFLQRLQATYPQLTPKDQRLCIYLKMNLSTKDIVPLMNISVRGVEVSRYRLRKKLELDSTVNLNEFMMRF